MNRRTFALRSSALLIFPLLLVFAAAVPAAAQLTTGTIRGTVKDDTGGVLPGVSITITQTETGAVRSLTTNEQGRYEAPNLQIGTYEIAADLSSFRRAVRARHMADRLRVEGASAEEARISALVKKVSAEN